MLCLYVHFFRHRQSAARKYQDKEADIIMAQVKVIHTCPGLSFSHFRYHMTFLFSIRHNQPVNYTDLTPLIISAAYNPQKLASRQQRMSHP